MSLNVAPMVDIIFCLCIFFMCSFHFKQLEGKMESWLPKDKGVFGDPVPNPILEEVRVFMKWDSATGLLTRKVNAQLIGSDEEMGAILQERIEKFKSLNRPDTPVIVDADPNVPWKDVITVMDICKSRKLEKVELAAPMPGQWEKMDKK
ncbi:MAG: biopolymer transporter ExbD [Planctomycetes bacterium]|nr:biopolymer transporter ExbD [Planctomycetota bacterium]